ncbi:DUF1298 domain-containing protein [Trichonephila clavipes]|nr:DUF1298 domain-containing protein [Trichonephila clavipes]
MNALKLSIPVDLRHDEGNTPFMGCRFSQVCVRLPSNTEGAVPRLWEVRRRMEELKTSPDTLVMYGAVYCLLPILPEAIAQWILNTVIRKATVVLANVPGPEDLLSLGSKKLKKIIFWMSPRPEIPVVFSVISYAGSIQLAVSADKMVVTQPHLLVKEFVTEWLDDLPLSFVQASIEDSVTRGSNTIPKGNIGGLSENTAG